MEFLVSSNEYDFKDITVLTPYNGQLAAFNRRLDGLCSLWLSEKDRDSLVEEGLLALEDAQKRMQVDVALGNMLKLATIDNFQGEESKIVILSTVRSNYEGSVGFLKTPNRINVACSRAKNGFYIVGNASLMRNVVMWDQVLQELSTHGKIGPHFRTCCPRHPQQIRQIREPHQWYAVHSCKVPCGYHFSCGHPCRLDCHAEALHERMGCQEPCQKYHQECSHPCQRHCGEPCGQCTFGLYSVGLPCAHSATMTCSDVMAQKHPDQLKCEEIVGFRKLDCSHQQPIVCSKRDRISECKETCGKKFDCGHQCPLKCHVGPCSPCQFQCSRACPHGVCTRKCTTVCNPCLKKCEETTCTHQNSCTTLCCLPCNRLPCSEPCPKLLSCNHQCPSLCGEKCPNYCSECNSGYFSEKNLIFLPCGHKFDVPYLDKLFGMHNVYKIGETGRIEALATSPVQQTQACDVSCPDCQKPVGTSIKRYAQLHNLSTFEQDVDLIYANLNKNIHRFMGDMERKIMDLDCSFDAASSELIPGPLTGKKNEDLIRTRINATSALEIEIASFTGRFSSFVVKALLRSTRWSGKAFRSCHGNS